MFGLLITFLCSKYEYDANGNKTVSPKVPTLCPGYSDADPKKSGCRSEGMEWQAFFNEFMGSFIFLFSWVIIRNLQLKGDLFKAQNIIKPVFVMLVYSASFLSG